MIVSGVSHIPTASLRPAKQATKSSKFRKLRFLAKRRKIPFSIGRDTVNPFKTLSHTLQQKITLQPDSLRASSSSFFSIVPDRFLSTL